MLMPLRVKFRKHQRGRMKGKASRGNRIAFGEYGLQALGCRWITGRQIEAGRRAISHFIQRGGRVWIRIFPDKSVSARPAESRMGSGKGMPEYWVAVVRPGNILFEIGGVSKDTATKALELASHKMPIKTRVVVKK